jgi:hypothetical protein
MKKLLSIQYFQIIALLVVANQTTVAQESPKTTFSGNADFYYRFDFANAGEGITNNVTSFTNSNDSFELGMASIKATHKEGKASVFADLGFGNRAKEFSYNENTVTYDPKTNGNFLIKQLNMTYEFSNKFKVAVGSFATHLGFELLDATDNKNYSMSYAFTNGPFFNTGVKAQYTSGAFSIMGGITNPTDFKSATASGANQKTAIGQIAYTVDSGSIYLNFSSGNNYPATFKSQQIDLVATKKISDKFTLGINGTFANVTDYASNVKTKWFSAIGYAQIVTSKASTLAYRLEYFDDKDGTKYLTPDLNIISNTLSMNFKEGKFTFIPEIRFDRASKDTFFKKNSAGDPSKTAGSILFATTYSF